MTRNTRNSRFDRRATEKARAITKRKAKKQNIIIATVAIALVAVISTGFIIFGAMNTQPKVANTSPTTVSAKADKAAQTTQKSAQTATQAPAQKTQTTAAQPAAAQTTAQSNTKSTAQTTAKAATQNNTQPTTQKATEAQDKIEKINGERVYIDTKRKAPEKTGTPAHYYANGKTSYGFDWDYSADNSNFVLSCNYNFDKQQYDFSFYGTKAGTSHVTLYYFTADNVKVPVSLTVNVDSSLNVSLA